jgi:hypothetical protein
VTIVGAVDKPVTLTHDQLIEHFPPHSVVATLASPSTGMPCTPLESASLS